jgi:hypothetical protein
MVVLIAKSTQIEVWIPIDLHVKWFNWSMTFPKKSQKFDKPLELHLKGFNWSMTFPKKSQNILKTYKCQLERNLAKWGGSWCKVKLKSSVSFLSIEFEHVNCHSSAYLTQNKRLKKLAKLKKNITLNTYSNSIYVLHFTYGASSVNVDTRRRSSRQRSSRFWLQQSCASVNEHHL